MFRNLSTRSARILSQSERATLLAVGDEMARHRDSIQEAQQCHEKRHMALMIRASRRR